MRERHFKKAAVEAEVYHSSSEELESDEDSGRPLQIKDFCLTNDQYLMIMSKLPKTFFLQPVRNMHKSRKLLSEITEKPTKRQEKERKQEQKERKDVIGRREASKMTIKSNESVEIEEQPSIVTASGEMSCKSQRIFLRQNIVYYDLEKESEPDPPPAEPISHIDPIVPLKSTQEILISSAAGKEDTLEDVPQKVSDKLEAADEGETHKELPARSKSSKRGRRPKLRSVEPTQKPASFSAASRDCKSEEKAAPPLPPPEPSQEHEQKFWQEWLILKSLQRHSMIDPFTSPVDELRDCAPNYFSIVKRPMDLATIEGKLRSHAYQVAGEFHEDVQQMWKNSRIFNRPGSAMVKLTAQLEKYYEHLKNGKKMKADGGEHIRGRKR